MKPLFYIIFKSIKNGILELRKKPGKIVMYIIFIAFLGFTFWTSGKGKISSGALNEDIYGCIVTGLILIFTVPDILTSLNNGATFFRGADVNLVFTAPLKPQKVLVYGFLKQIYTVLLSMFFLLFQVPNLYRYRNVKPYAIILIIAGLSLLIISNSLIKLIIYSIASKEEKNKDIISKLFKALGILFAAFYLISLYNLKSPGKAIVYLLNNKFIEYVPVYGWIRNVMMAAIKGTDLFTFVFIVLTVAFVLVCLYALYKMDMDYYEDVLAATEVKEEAVAAVRTGQKTYNLNNKKRKVRKVQYTKKGSGASAIFFRQMLEYNKTGFGFINIISIIYFISAITAGIYLPIKDLRIILGFSVYLLMIFSFADKWQQELAKPYVYLIPDSAFKKVLYSTVVDNIKNLFDGCLIFITIGIFFKSNPVLVILCILGYVSIGSLFVYGGVLIQRIVGSTKNVVFTAVIRMIMLLFIVAPGIIIMAVFSAIYDNTFGQYISYLVFIVYNLFFSTIIILLSKGIFENIELNQ